MNNFDELVRRLNECDLIVFDGASDAGKTYVANQVASIMDKPHLDFDRYVDEFSNAPYINRINYSCLRNHIDNAEQSVVLSGVFALEIVRTLGYEEFTLVYVANVIPGTERYREQEFNDEETLLALTPESNYQEVLNGDFGHAQEIIDQMVRVYHKNEKSKTLADIIYLNQIE